jgi:hypothetical protein
MTDPITSSAPSYLCVFHADPAISDDVVDSGQDPDFSLPMPTWGICRPDVRRAVRPGSHVVFVGYYRADRRYLVKGWLRVADVIGYVEALSRFPSRRNVIIRDRSDDHHVPRAWKRLGLLAEVEERYGTAEPRFLTELAVGGRTLVQNPVDDHEIDNGSASACFFVAPTSWLDA